jgi:hypothetical protein
MTLFVSKIGGQFKLDGFDIGPEYGMYQMVPLGGIRTLSIKTDKLPVNVSVSSRNSRAILIGKFRSESGGPIPGIDPARMANNLVFKVPKGTVAKFDVQGMEFANTSIEANEIDENRNNESTLSQGIIIGVKPKITKKVSLVYFSDLQGDVKSLFAARGIDPRAIMAKANTSLLSQLNLELQEIEPGKPIAEVKSARNLKNPIDLDAIINPEKIKASFVMASEVFENFPRLFPSTHFVILLTRPVRMTGQSDVLDVNIRFATGTNVIFFTPSTAGADDTLKAFMHEVGHACGAEHVTDRASVMFPRIGPSLTTRFLGEHIEAVHSVCPMFSRAE